MPLIVLALLAMVGGFVELPVTLGGRSVPQRLRAESGRPPSSTRPRARGGRRGTQIAAGVVSLAVDLPRVGAVPAPPAPSSPRSRDRSRLSRPAPRSGVTGATSTRCTTLLYRAAARLVCADRQRDGIDRVVRRARLERPGGLASDAAAPKPAAVDGSVGPGPLSARSSSPRSSSSYECLIASRSSCRSCRRGRRAARRWSHRSTAMDRARRARRRSRRRDGALDLRRSRRGRTARSPWLAEQRAVDRVARHPHYPRGRRPQLLLILLTACPGPIAVAASWTEIHDDVGFFHFQLLWVLSGMHRRVRRDGPRSSSTSSGK